MAASAACCAAGQESDFQAGTLDDLPEFPAEVDEPLLEPAFPFSADAPTPEAAVPLEFVPVELVPLARGLDLSGVGGD